MQISQISGYELTSLAIWPKPFYEKGSGYLMHECKLKNDGSLQWYKKYIYVSGTSIKNDHYQDLTTATDAAKAYNIDSKKRINELNLSEIEKNSLFLKLEKTVTALSRRVYEEKLMLDEAIRRNLITHKERCEPIIADHYSTLMKALIDILNETPYVKIARLSMYGVTLIQNEQGVWIRTKHTKQTSKYYYRDRIARGFGLSGFDHWGKTKAKIRSMLLPRANKLLQLASVKRMLDEAYNQGHRVLISGDFVFWYEEKHQVGWLVKEVNRNDSTKNGNVLWKKGRILSKNHGRIVVLPYIKENGEQVLGHTKNTAHDGKALPRHKDDFVELPFEVLNDDLMIGLFGELYYE
ncbi:hypothetical protein [Aliivibrio fischeri]|uniref:hypothetical protein n=1 Tax=Aliivibrio fischeri TaxID=668 RepID=UPI0012DA9AE2|nr:hypothetical protein [Aliivibrio fischeri]MUJ22593.1 hypothetical protein [Aliivibrio fischeri]